MLNIGRQLTPEQRVSKAVVDIMANPKYTALAGVLMIGERRVETDPAKCPTAYTNGKNEVYGADFIADLNDKQLRFLILHEVYHKPCLLYTSPSPRDGLLSRMPSSA